MSYKKPHTQVQYNIQDWIPYKPYSGAAEQGNQLVQNRTIGHPLRQGGSSWKTAPAAAVPAQRTVTEPCTLQFRPFWSPFSKSSSSSLLNSWKGATQSPPITIAGQKQLIHTLSYERSWINGRQQTDHKLLDEATRITAKLSAQILGPNFVIKRVPEKILFHQSQEIAKGLGSRIPPIVPQPAMKDPSWFFAASSKSNVPIFQKSGIHNLLLWTSEPKVLAAETEIYIIDMAREPSSLTICCDAKSQPKIKVEPPWNNTNVFRGNDVQFFLNHYVLMKNSKQGSKEILTHFNKEMKQTKLHAHHLVQVEVPVHPILLNNTNTLYLGTKWN